MLFLDTFIYLPFFVYTWHLHLLFHFHLTTYITHGHSFMTEQMEFFWEYTACSCLQVTEITTFCILFFLTWFFTRLDNLPWTIGSVAFFNNNTFVIQHKEPHKENISKTQSLLKVCASFPGLDYCLCDRKYIILIDRVILYSTLCINGLNISHREILHYVISNRKNASTCCQIKPSFYHLLFVTIH